MRPLEEAMAVYQKEHCARTFNEDLNLHYRNGFVISTPQYFIMARPVPKDAAYKHIVDPHFNWPWEDCDTWHVYLAAGDMRKFWDICPPELRSLEYASWERNNRLRFRKMTRIRDQILK